MQTFLQQLESQTMIKQINPIMQYFEYAHLPQSLQAVSSQICGVAKLLNDTVNDGPEKSAGLRKLLEAKDCFVRAALERKGD